MTTPTSLAELRQFFDAVDTDHSGAISVTELQDALGKSGFVFSLAQVNQFLKICGATGPNGLPFSDFEKLHTFLTTAQSNFQAAANGAPSINKQQLRQAIDKSGYTWIEAPAFDALCRAYDPDNDGMFGMPEFAAIMAFLKSVVGVFNGFDQQRRGAITLSISQFLYAGTSFLRCMRLNCIHCMHSFVVCTAASLSLTNEA